MRNVWVFVDETDILTRDLAQREPRQEKRGPSASLTPASTFYTSHPSHRSPSRRMSAGRCQTRVCIKDLDPPPPARYAGEGSEGPGGSTAIAHGSLRCSAVAVKAPGLRAGGFSLPAVCRCFWSGRCWVRTSDLCRVKAAEVYSGGCRRVPQCTLVEPRSRASSVVSVRCVPLRNAPVAVRLQ